MKTNIKYIALFATLLLVACSSKNTPSPAPNWQAEADSLAVAPHWEVANTSLYPSSMTITAEVPLTNRSVRDTIAALLCANDEVLGVCANEGQNSFALYVHGPLSDVDNMAFRLCYYSAEEKQLYVSYVADDLLFENDATIGTSVSPEQFIWIPCGSHNRVCRVLVELGEGNWNEGDELALFVGDQCRVAARPYQTNPQSQTCNLWLPFDKEDTKTELRYYNASTAEVSTETLRLDAFTSTLEIPLH